MVSQLVTAVPLDSLADAVKDVLQDTLATHYLVRDVALAMHSTVTAITVMKEDMKAAMVVCASAR